MSYDTKEILAALRNWPLWKRMTDTPNRLDALERRLAALEQGSSRIEEEITIGGKSCPSCGAADFEISETDSGDEFALSGTRKVTRTCRVCGYSRAYIEDVA